jgi:hypothetical protein
MKGESL